MIIIGIGGMVRSGKDTLADMLIEHGFYGFSFGDYIRERARERHKDKEDPISVANMTNTANWLRETYGPDVVLKAALDRYEELNTNNQYKGIVLYSVRVPVEVDFIIKHDGEVVWVEASAEVRHARGMNALREGEKAQTLEEFMRQEALQWNPQPGIPESAQMNVEYVKNNATLVIENNEGGIEQFLETAQKLIEQKTGITI